MPVRSQESRGSESGWLPLPGVDEAPVALSTTPVDLAVKKRGLWPRVSLWIQQHMPSMSSRGQGLILLNIMTLLMGSNWVVVKESGASFDPFVFAALRFSLAAAVFLPVLQTAFKDKEVSQAGCEIGLWSALGYLTQSAALSMTDASRASLLSTFTVLGVPALAGLSGKKVKPIVWVCAIFALVGTSMLEGGGAEANFGDALSIASALFFALQLFRTEHFSRTLPSSKCTHLMAMSMLTTAVISIVGAAGIHHADIAMHMQKLAQLWSQISHSHIPVTELLYTSWCTTDLVLLLEMVALQTVSSTEAAIIYSMEPISGAVFASYFLGERLSTMGMVGAAIIVLSSLATQLNGAVEEESCS